MGKLGSLSRSLVRGEITKRYQDLVWELIDACRT